MKRLFISLAFAATLIGSGSKGLELQEAHAQPAATADVGGSEAPPEAPAAEGVRAVDVPRGAQPAGGGTTTAPAEAGDAPDAETAADDLAVQLLAAIRSGEWLPAFGLALMLLIAGLRHWALGSWVPWFKTRRGGYVLAFGTAAVAVFGTALAAGDGLSASLLGVAFGAGWAAIGIYQTGKDAAGGGD